MFSFQLVTPERSVLSQELASLTCPTTLGEITVLPHHAALVAELKAGELRAKTPNDEFFIHVSGGFVEVKDDGRVIVLADAAEHHYEIDEQRAAEALKRAEKAMKEVSVTSAEYAQVAAALERSLARLNIARKRARKKATLSEKQSI